MHQHFIMEDGHLNLKLKRTKCPTNIPQKRGFTSLNAWKLSLPAHSLQYKKWAGWWEWRNANLLSTLEVYGDVVKPLHGTTSDHFLCSEEGKKRKNISEVCQQVSASLSQPEPYCKTSSVPRPSPFIVVGWPREEGTWQTSILLGEGRPAGETPQTARKGGTLPPSESFCMRIEYYLENRIPDLLRTPDSLKRSLSVRPSAVPGPHYPGAAMAGEVLPLARHRPAMERQLLPRSVCRLKGRRGEN